ncbi:Hypothetical predicted protein [Cloeon dipterum]|uniref:Uncharacterized protein n=1 Tax=Cloeon dipterum TaxID=197152 RepID=A0A8S1C2X2_9INSE|nr:Hypothetical predicted protein [Cloeon dipterum]
MKDDAEWKICKISPQSSAGLQEINENEYQQTMERTITERAVVGIPESESMDSVELDRLLDSLSRDSDQETDKLSAFALFSNFEDQLKKEREEAMLEIKSRVSNDLSHFESARQKLRELLNPIKRSEVAEREEKKIEGKKAEVTLICDRCKDVDLEALIEDNAELRRKLDDVQSEHSDNKFKCICEMRYEVDKMKLQENSLLETISFKKERLETLATQCHDVELQIEQNKIKLCDRLSEVKKIDSLLISAEETFKSKCKQIQEYEMDSKRADGKGKKMREDVKTLSAKINETEKRIKSLHSQLAQLQNECRQKEQAVLKERSTLVKLDDVAVKLRSEIKNLKDEIQMLSESSKYHRSEVEARQRQVQALILAEKQFDEELKQQRRDSNAQMQAVATEVERTRTLKLVADDYLKEAQSISDTLQTLRASKTSVDKELEELKQSLECAESQLESELDRLEALRESVKNVQGERHLVAKTLMSQVQRDRTKIRALLDDIEAQSLVVCEAMYIKTLITRDTKQLERDAYCAGEKNVQQEVFDLEHKIDHYKQLIAALGTKIKQADGDDDFDEQVIRLTYHRMRLIGENEIDCSRPGRNDTK